MPAQTTVTVPAGLPTPEPSPLKRELGGPSQGTAWSQGGLQAGPEASAQVVGEPAPPTPGAE